MKILLIDSDWFGWIKVKDKQITKKLTQWSERNLFLLHLQSDKVLLMYCRRPVTVPFFFT